MQSKTLILTFLFSIILPTIVNAQVLSHCYADGCVNMLAHGGETQQYIDSFSSFQDLVRFFTRAWVDRGEGPARVDESGLLLGMSCSNGSYFNVLRCTNGATNYPSCNNNVCTNGATNYPSCDNNVCTNGATNFPSCNNNVPPCDRPAICSNGNLVNACTGSVVQTCVAGCAVGSCNAECPVETICKPNNDRYRRSANCQETLIEACSMQCYTSGSSQNFCRGNDIYRNTGPCTSEFVSACTAPSSAGCSQGACLPPPAPRLEPISVTFRGTAFNSDGHLQARPPLVNRGNTSQIYWNATNVTSCSVTGSNGDSWNASSGGTAGTMTSPLFTGTTYTLVCTPLAGSSAGQIRESVEVNIVPVFNEI